MSEFNEVDQVELVPDDTGCQESENFTEEDFLLEILEDEDDFEEIPIPNYMFDPEVARQELEAYMQAQGYGEEDYEIYSQDPQWRHYQEYIDPEQKLPELMPESLQAQYEFDLNHYMELSGYTEENQAEYSQDPIWRELYSQAYPEEILPELTEEGKVSDAYYQMSRYMEENDIDPTQDISVLAQDPNWREWYQTLNPEAELPPMEYIGDEDDFEEIPIPDYMFDPEVARQELEAYMQAQGYGEEDYEIYSQDPQWRHYQEYIDPEQELPELMPESLQAQYEFDLNHYMELSGYTEENQAEYSQDPIWRELYSQAYPEEILPELTEEGKLSNAYYELSKYMDEQGYTLEDYEDYSQDKTWRELYSVLNPGEELPNLIEYDDHVFDAVPELRRQAVMDSFADAPYYIKKMVNENFPRLLVQDSGMVMDKNGNWVERCSHCSGDTIRMRKSCDDDEYAIVFGHEAGHFVDHNMRYSSCAQEFSGSIDSDMLLFQGEQGSAYKDQMLEDLSKTDAIHDRNISDILSGNFCNDQDIQDRYKKEGSAYYGHKNDYWDGTKGVTQARERECFANLFNIYKEGNPDSVRFVEKYFPESVKEFKRIVNRK